MNEHQVNRLLGYPDDARLLIINADDFAMCHAVNDAILQTLREGMVVSTSLMTPCPWAPHAMHILNENPEVPFGVHLTLVCDFAACRWGPVSSRESVPSLVDGTGHFLRGDQVPEITARARIDEVETEFRAQIETVLAAKLAPTHLDWHCLADGGREDIFDVTMALAKEYGLALRVHDRDHAARCQRDGLPVNDFHVLDSYSIDPDEKATRYPELLRDLPAGLNEWAVHPSLGDAEAQALEPDTWRIRKADFDFFLSHEARDLIEEEGIVLIDYRALQAVWAS